MELDQAIRRRRMVRDFSDEPVPKEVVDRVLEHALHAPSAGNTQGWEFVVLEGDQQTAAFWQAVWAPEVEPYRKRWPGLMRAPVVVVPLASEQAYLRRYAEPDKEGSIALRRWPVPYWLVDVAFACMLILLSATDQGLGALYFGLVAGEQRLLGELGVPPGYRPVGAIALGYPGTPAPSRSASRRRRPFDEVVHRGRW